MKNTFELPNIEILDIEKADILTCSSGICADENPWDITIEG